jgi:hypothetical protein
MATRQSKNYILVLFSSGRQGTPLVGFFSSIFRYFITTKQTTNAYHHSWRESLSILGEIYDMVRLSLSIVWDDTLHCSTVVKIEFFEKTDNFVKGENNFLLCLKQTKYKMFRLPPIAVRMNHERLPRHCVHHVTSSMTSQGQIWHILNIATLFWPNLQ